MKIPMNSSRAPLLRLLGVLLSAVLAAPATRAQEDPDKPAPSAASPTQPQKLRVFRLQNVNPQEAMNIVVSIVNQRMQIASDERLNQLLVRAEESTLNTVADVIAQIDVAAAGANREASPVRTVLQLKNRNVDELVNIAELHLSPHGRFQRDSTTNSLVVNDLPSVCDSLRDTLSRLDTLPSSLDVEFFVVGFGGTETLPDDLAPVSAELTRMGLRKLGLLTRSSVRTEEGATFETSGSFGEGGNLEIKGSARTRELNGEKLAEIRLTAQIANRARDREGGGPSQHAEVQSTLTVPMGHWMVVGMAPSGGDPSEPLVLVMRCSQR